MNNIINNADNYFYSVKLSLIPFNVNLAITIVTGQGSTGSGHALGTRHHWDAASKTVTDSSMTFGVLNCAMRYETNKERLNAPKHNFLKTRYCTKGETWIMPGKGTTFAGHDCYGQINIKGN